MKRAIVLIVMLLMISGLHAQKFVREVRNTFSSFGAKTTKVVIPSTSLADLMLRDAVRSGWRISPFEFCTMEEYQKLKNDTSYFFLMRVDGRLRRELEPKIEYLTLIQGGPEVKRGLYSSHNIINLPLQEAGDNNGANLHLLPVYIDVIQNHIYRVQKDVTIAFRGNAIFSDKIAEVTGKRLLFAMEFLNYSIPENEFKSLFMNKISLATADEVEDAIMDSSKETVVPVLIKPRGESNGSYCYKLIIGTDSHELLFFRRHRVSSRMPAGFTREDIRKISVPFQF